MSGALGQSMIQSPGAGAEAIAQMEDGEEGATMGKIAPEIDFDALGEDALQDMLGAAFEAKECERVLGKVNLNVVGEVLKNQGEFVRLAHYPKGDIYDRESHAQYYYHSHRSETGEHGHFHTFLRVKGMPEDVAPSAAPTLETRPLGDEALAHFVALSCNKMGGLEGIFTTNRWVTHETWYDAPDLLAMLDRFEIDHAWPSWPTNRWISAVMRLFRPQIELLIQERDKTIDNWRDNHPDSDPLEDRKLEITSICRASIDEQLAKVEAALEKYDD